MDLLDINLMSSGSQGRYKQIVATKVFGMGIEKPDICHIVWNGVPESLLSWAQELRRTSRDGQQACATILYCKSHISHANSRVLNNLANAEWCNQILTGFSKSCQYFNALLAGIRRRKLLLAIYIW